MSYNFIKVGSCFSKDTMDIMYVRLVLGFKWEIFSKTLSTFFKKFKLFFISLLPLIFNKFFLWRLNVDVEIFFAWSLSRREG
jgi:hypothetical protein